MFTIDGENFDNYVLYTSVKRKFEKLADKETGRLQSGKMYMKLIGVFFNYELEIVKRSDCPVAVWDRLWDIITQKKEWYTLTLPYNQSTITFRAYIASGQQNLKRQEKNGTNFWDTITLEFIAEKPYF